MSRIAILFSVPALCALAAAQQSAGPLVGSTLALAVDGGANNSADATTHVHRNGFGGPLRQFTAPAAPDLQAILALHGAPSLDIDDISTGRDDIMVDSNGVTRVPPFGWGLFSFSFRNGAIGAPGSRLAAEPAADRGSAVFTWVLPGSLIPTPLIATVERSHGRAELAVPPGGDVDALDLPLVLGMDQTTLAGTEPGFQALLPAQSEIYFTVANASLGQVPAAWWNVPGIPNLPSGATILVTRRPPTGGMWLPPTVYKVFFELGLLQTDDIDALALDATNDTLIFSCAGNAYDQLLYIDVGTDGMPTPVPVKDPSNAPVSSATGSAGNDDIDAVCTLDPRIRSGIFTPDDFGASCGTPRHAYQPNLYPVGVSASAFRRYSSGQSHYDTWMIGWPPNTGQGPGWAILAITLGDTLSPAITAAIYPRFPANPVSGDPRRYTQTIPVSYALSGLPLTFRWFAADAAGTEISQAYPIKVFL